MRQIDPALLARLQSNLTNLAVCWVVKKSTGGFIRGTDRDRNLKITVSSYPGYNIEGTYLARAGIRGSNMRSSADMAVDNMEVEGAVEPQQGVVDVTAAEIEAGVLDHAPVIVFICDAGDPDLGQLIVRRGWLGEISRDSTGRYVTEIRGLTQALSQNIVQTAGERCSVKRFGDQFCKFDVAAVTRTGVVTEVTSRRFFTVALTPSDDPPVPTYFNGGRIAFTSGKNAGFFREVKRAIVSAGAAQIELWDEMPDDVEVDDTCTLEPGCDKTYETCRDVFQNIVNFRGYGIFIPGALELMKGPT